LITETKVSSSRAVAVIGLFAALYIVTSGLASFVSMLGYPEHFLRGILMTAVILRTGKKWSATTMGLVSGLVFAVSVPSPAPYLLPSTFVSGLVFDLVLLIGISYTQASRSRTRLMIGAGISGLAESLVALGILTYFSSSTLGATSRAIAIAWSADVVLNVVLSTVGAYIAFRFLYPRKRPAPSQSIITP
jgi:hypothetical protein